MMMMIITPQISNRNYNKYQRFNIDIATCRLQRALLIINRNIAFNISVAVIEINCTEALFEIFSAQYRKTL